MCNELTRESFDRPFSFIKLFGRKQQIQLVAAIKHVFQSTSPTRGDDDLAEVLKFVDGISIHVPYERGRQPAADLFGAYLSISIHVPYERGRPLSFSDWLPISHFNPRPLREGTTAKREEAYKSLQISIHVPYERGRPLLCDLVDLAFCISIHVPYERGRRPACAACSRRWYFNPRPLREGTTRTWTWYLIALLDFNPRPLREGTTPGTGVVQGSAPISIHVPYERGRRWFQRTFDSRIQFQSTSPTRGDDLLLFPPNHTPNYFNPRPLREGTTCSS